MSAVVCFADGFEEVEALTCVDYLRRAGIKVLMMSITGSQYVLGCHNIKVECDTLFDEEKISSSEIIILPGGLPGATSLFEDERLREKIALFAEEKMVAAICAAPFGLGEMGLLDGKMATVYPGFEKEEWNALIVRKNAVKDGRIITGRGPGAAKDFAILIIEALRGKSVAEKIKKEIMYSEKY